MKTEKPINIRSGLPSVFSKYDARNMSCLGWSMNKLH